MSILRDSCVNFARAVLIIVNIIIYLALWGLLGTESDDTGTSSQEIHEIVKLVDVDAPILKSKVVVGGQPEDFNEAIRLAYFGQGY